MKPEHPLPTELEILLEKLCEDRLTSSDIRRLEQLVMSSPEARWQYLAYLDLHGTLFWDAAGAGSPEPLSSHEMPVFDPPSIAVPATVPALPPTNRRRRTVAIVTTVASLAIGILAVWNYSVPTTNAIVADAKRSAPNPTPEADAGPGRSVPRTHGRPVEIGVSPGHVAQSVAEPSTSAVPDSSIPQISSRAIVARINDDIQSRWTEIGIQPSARADDSEWMRRVFLDILGRVPTVREAEAFLADRREQKREDLIEQLLDDSGYVRNFTTKWSNLLIGRAANPQINRSAFEKFLRLSFAGNRPWNQIVADLISAEGSSDEIGAANFLIAHLNNDATPATAVCSKLFLGQQLHCNQCHNNPFNETKQVSFWELNSFFQQTVTHPRQRRDPDSGRLLGTFVELATEDSGGPTYFETRTGLMQVAYPRFNGYEVNPGPETNRRRELARLMTDGEQPQLAAAFVNRMWEHFFGIGFTRIVDDMGPHSPASHPELLAVLTNQFIRSGYDPKQLVRWICRSEAYQLSSRFSAANQNDDPSLGDLPAFSRTYVRPLTAEQTYDSFLTATKAHQVGAVDWTQAEQNRQQWLQQFVVAFNTDDNDEKMAFDGSIGNALCLMNGPLIEKALDTAAGSFLGEVVRQRTSETDKIRSLCLATLSRVPTPGEMTSMKKFLRQASSAPAVHGHPDQPYQDLFWALLNSTEFSSVH